MPIENTSKLTQRITSDVTALVSSNNTSKLPLLLATVSSLKEKYDTTVFANLMGAFRNNNICTFVGVSPSDKWTGTAGSGFATTPTDPTRVTAKPAMRPLSVPLRAFTNHAVVGVIAGANCNGTLRNNMGLKKVRVYYEGNVVDIDRPSYYTFQDVNGVTRSYFGWWAVLLHNGKNSTYASTGGANVYFEAIPADATMQNRVIGPYRYFPRDTLYDLELTIEPSQSVVVGSRYTTLKDAGDYIRTAGKNFPRITIKESGIHPFDGITAAYTTWGYVTIEASVPASIGKATRNTTGTNYDADNLCRCRLGPLQIRGKNLTMDMTNYQMFYSEATFDPGHWLNGCVITTTEPEGRGALWRKGTRQISQVIRGLPWFTEVDLSHLHNAMYQCNLARGCSLYRIASDIFTESWCIAYNRVDDCDSVNEWNIYRPAMTVTYVGAGTTATIEASGTNISTRVLTAKVNGASVGTFTVSNSPTAYSTGGNYHFSQIVAWVNSLGDGWSATLINDDYMAAAIQANGTIGPFGAQNCKGVNLTLYSYFDIHADFYQKNLTGTFKENVVIFGNVATNLVTQNIFLAGTTGCMDFLIMNNCFDNKMYTSGSGRNDYIGSQFGRGAMKHVVFVHNSFASQGLGFRTDDGLTSLDSYTLVANNIIRSINWVGAAGTAPKILNNHLFDGNPVTANSVNTTVGGLGTSLFMDSPNGDFSPTPYAATFRKVPVAKNSLSGNDRAALDLPGAI